MKNLRKARFLFVISLAISLLVVGVGGFFIGKAYESKNFRQTIDGVDFKIFWQAYEELKEKYVGEVDPQKYLYGAINGGYASTGDPYTIFMPPESAQKFQQELSGELEGVGIKLGTLDSLPTVIAPLPNSPAEKAGIKPKDKILKVDDFSTENEYLDTVVDKIRGKAGTKVKLMILKSNTKEVKEIELTREKIEVKSVEVSYKGDVVIIAINEFGVNSSSEFEKIYKEAVEKNINKVVLDLRGNPGGLLNSSVEIAEYFLKEGQTIVIEQGKSIRQEEKVKIERGWQNAKLAVLVDEGSASASEIVAGAIKDNGRAKIIGSKTYGKGTVQELISFIDGTNSKITISKWLTPKGTDIDKNGIEPDIKIESSENPNFDNDDPQLSSALNNLN